MKIISEKNSKVLLWLGLLLLLIGLCLFFWKESLSSDFQINSEKISHFGDFVGGVIGSIWSLAGVLLFYVALTEQRKDIEINRDALNAQVEALKQQVKEFELQRTELEETRNVFKEQSTTLQIQRFENTFFQLLSLYHELVDKLNIRKTPGSDSLEKREVIISFYNDLCNAIASKNSISHQDENGTFFVSKNPSLSKEVAYERIKEAYAQVYFKTYKQVLSHYFRNVYHIFKFIYKSDLVVLEMKQFYASLVRAQLSSDELFILLYNSLIPNLGYPNFLFLIREFDIMQNFDFTLMNTFPFNQDIYDELLNSVTPELNF